ncbi:MAG: hypothetical protein CO034_00980 [Parcubacteria group bacterium CG_4_9_14_0_2_um_filter_35_11]|nr:MAG: hypothetical protein CO034_00980 [Parcubacteria group bacterium CG_4_9_14_0_2_um_filter_35_11]
MKKNLVKIARLESFVLNSMRIYLKKQEFIELIPPKIVRASGACENIDTLFEVGVNKKFQWFKEKGRFLNAYLSQTAQLYLEAFTPFLDKVYSIGPSFRAEAGNDNRHLTEFTMVEIEFKGGFQELLKYIEEIIWSICQDILGLSQKSRRAMGIKKSDISSLKKIKIPFPKIAYKQAIEILKLNFGEDISSDNERKLTKQFNNQPIFITHFPNPIWKYKKRIKVEKFFNMSPNPFNPAYILSADLILPYGGEAVGAAQRVHKLQTIILRLTKSQMFQRLKKKGGSIEDFKWYLEKIKEKIVPHAGCGFGVARIIKFIKREENIKNCVTFLSNQEILI